MRLALMHTDLTLKAHACSPFASDTAPVVGHRRERMARQIENDVAVRMALETEDQDNELRVDQG